MNPFPAAYNWRPHYDGRHVGSLRKQTSTPTTRRSGRSGSIDVAAHPERPSRPAPFRSPRIASRRSIRRPRGAFHDPGTRQWRRLRACLGRGNALGRAASWPQDPSDRSRNRGDSAHHRIQPLRHRSHLGRRRALHATWQGEESECAGSTLAAARCWRNSSCHPERQFRGSNPTAATSSVGGGSSGKVRVVRRPK